MDECIRILSEAPKWRTFTEKPKNNAAKTPVKRPRPQDTTGAAVKDDNDSTPSRPIGCKSAKKQNRDQDVLVQSTLKLAAASEKLASETARKTNVIEWAADIQLFTKSLDGLDDDAVEFLKLQRSLALQRLKAKLSQ
jgi:hypothetical protein